MLILGLTGGIATGKSTISTLFGHEGVPVINADAIAHELLTQAPVIKHISKLAPEAVKHGIVCRATLGALVFDNNALLGPLEALLHPLIIDEEEKQLQHYKKLGKKIVVVDIPLLFETRHTNDFDLIITASCSQLMQTMRALAREGMTKAKLSAIMKRQLPTKVKEKLADVIISTGLNKAHTMQQIKQLLTKLDYYA